MLKSVSVVILAAVSFGGALSYDSEDRYNFEKYRNEIQIIRNKRLLPGLTDFGVIVFPFNGCHNNVFTVPPSGGFRGVPDLSTREHLYSYQTIILNVYDKASGACIMSGYWIESPVGSGKQSSPFDDVVIFCSGYDPGNKFLYYEMAASDRSKNLVSLDPNDGIESVLEAGFDFVWVDLFEGDDDVRNMGKAFAYFVYTAAQIIHANGVENIKMAVGGVSMGGLIARLGMKYLQRLGTNANGTPLYKAQHVLDANVKLYQIDSPNRGGQINIDLQQMVKEYKDHDGVKENWAVLGRPAPTQMLYWNETVGGSSEHDKFYQYVSEMGLPSRQASMDNLKYRQLKTYALSQSEWRKPTTAVSVPAYRVDKVLFGISKYWMTIYYEGRDLAAGSKIDLEEHGLRPGFMGSMFESVMRFAGLQLRKKTNLLPTFIPTSSALDMDTQNSSSPYDCTLTLSRREHGVIDNETLRVFVNDILRDDNSVSLTMQFSYGPSVKP